MPWAYSQTTAQLTHNGGYIGTGYSGNGAGRENPRFENVPSMGPIPRGRWTIGPVYDDSHRYRGKGPVVMRLTPVGHNAHGRTNFLIHGDSRRNPGNASEGCIVLDRAYRTLIASSPDRVLVVVQ